MRGTFVPPPQQTETGLPPNWEVRHSNSKNLPYYFNSQEKQSRWEPPEGTDTEKLKVYMAKYHSPSAGAGNGGGGAEGKIRAAHLLVKHTGSRRPSSWKEVRPLYISSHAKRFGEEGGEQALGGIAAGQGGHVELPGSAGIMIMRVLACPAIKQG